MTDRDVIGRGGNCRRGGGVLVVSICGGCVGGCDVVLDAVVLGGVAVVCRGQHHRCLVGFGVLVVEVDDASAAVGGGRNTGNQAQTTEFKGGVQMQERTSDFYEKYIEPVLVVLIRMAANGCFCGAGTILTFWLGASLWEVRHIKI